MPEGRMLQATNVAEQRMFSTNARWTNASRMSSTTTKDKRS